MRANQNPVQIDPVRLDSLKALDVLRGGKNWLVLLLSLAVLAEAGLFAAAKWGSVLQESAATWQRERPAATQPATESSPLRRLSPPAMSPQRWHVLMRTVLPLCGFVGFVSAVLLLVVCWAGVQMAVLGRLGAVTAMLSGFFWALLGLAVLFPWGNIIGDKLGQAVPWAFYGYDEIVQATMAVTADAPSSRLLLLRFIFWPLAGMLCYWLSAARFGRAYWQAVAFVESEAKKAAQPQ